MTAMVVYGVGPGSNTSGGSRWFDRRNLMHALFAVILFTAASLIGMPAWADSVAVSSGNGHSSVTTGKGKPCRIESSRDGGSTTVTTGNGGATASTTVSPGGRGTSVTVGSGSSGDSGCVVTHPGN